MALLMKKVVQSTLRFHKAESGIASFLKDTKIASGPYYLIDLGALFSEDCLNVLLHIKDGVVDTVLADPPF
jgi:hypothetical protein